MWRSRSSGADPCWGGSRRGASGAGSRSLKSSPSSVGTAALIGALGASATVKRQRRAQRASRHKEDGPDKLRRMAVTPATDAKYRKAHRELLAFAAPRKLPLASLTDWDLALDQYGVALYDRGEAPAAFRLAIYGIAHVLDAPSCSESVFPLAKKALRGFLRPSPGGCRDPPPEEAIWLMAHWLVLQAVLLGQQAVFAAAAMLITFDAYLRPGEALGLECRHVTPPRRGIVRYRDWVITIAPQGDKPAKHLDFDCSVVVGLPPRVWAVPLLIALHKRARPDGRLFENLNLVLCERLLRKASAACHVSSLRVDPHSLRHAGPSIDSYEKRFSLAEIQSRGRWRCGESCRRYVF